MMIETEEKGCRVWHVASAMMGNLSWLAKGKQQVKNINYGAYSPDSPS